MAGAAGPAGVEADASSSGCSEEEGQLDAGESPASDVGDDIGDAGSGPSQEEVASPGSRDAGGAAADEAEAAAPTSAAGPSAAAPAPGDGALVPSAPEGAGRKVPTMIRVETLQQLRSIILEQDHDFWVTCMNESAHMSASRFLQTAKCDGVVAADCFSHCYICESSDLNRDVGQLHEACGLGLRRKKLFTHNSVGYIFVLCSPGSFSVLAKLNRALPITDPRLSTWERIRRSGMIFKQVSFRKLTEKAKRYPNDFWMTTYSGIDAQETRHRVVAAKMAGRFAVEWFGKCFIYECRKLLLAVDKFMAACGQGCRGGPRAAPIKVKKDASGCLAVLIPKDAVQQRKEAIKKRKLALSVIQKKPARRRKEEPTPKPKKVGVDAAATLEQLQPGAALEDLIDFGALGEEPESPARAPSPEAELVDEAELLRRRQLQALERRVAALIPELMNKVDVTTEFVQTRVAEMMRKPRARFDPFQKDLEAMWQRLLAQEKHRRLWRALARKAQALLPSLPLATITAEGLQAQLEKACRRPSGKFAKFIPELEALLKQARADAGEDDEAVTEAEAAGEAESEGDDGREGGEVELLSVRPAAAAVFDLESEAEGHTLLSDADDDAVFEVNSVAGGGSSDSDLEVLGSTPAAPASASAAGLLTQRWWASAAGGAAEAPQASDAQLQELLQLAAQASQIAACGSGAGIALGSGAAGAAPLPPPVRDKASGAGLETALAEAVDEASDGDPLRILSAGRQEAEAGFAPDSESEGLHGEPEAADEDVAACGPIDVDVEVDEHMEVDEFGFEFAAEHLKADSPDDKAVEALRFLARGAPALALLRQQDWRGPLQEIAARRGPGSLPGSLALRVLSSWTQRLAGQLAVQASGGSLAAAEAAAAAAAEAATAGSAGEEAAARAAAEIAAAAAEPAALASWLALDAADGAAAAGAAADDAGGPAAMVDD